MGRPEDWKVIGVDPAPGKNTWMFDDEDGFSESTPGRLSQALSEMAKGAKRILIAWDAPLAFDEKFGFTDRPIDKVARRFIKNSRSRIADGAVSVQPFGSCPHWTISCHVMGFPYRTGEGNAYQLIGDLSDLKSRKRKYVIEVHPALALALWWIDSSRSGKMERYKPGRRVTVKDSKEKMNSIVEMLEETFEQFHEHHKPDNPDKLDAWVAWKLGKEAVEEKAKLVGSGAEGYYVLPDTDATSRLIEEYSEFQSEDS